MKLTWNPAHRAIPTTAVYDVKQILNRITNNMGLPMEDHQRINVEAGYWHSFHNMLAGLGTEGHMDHIVVALNVALVLAEMGYAPEYLELIERAQEGAFRSVQRGLASGRWAFNGGDIAPVREALEVHSAQVEVAAKDDIKHALEVIKQRARDGVVYSAEPV